MSAFREENAVEKFVKQYLTASLDQLARSQLLKSSDELVDYLLEEVGLDRPCTEWIKTASNTALRELLKEHQKKFHQYHTGAGQATHAAPGPSVQRFGNQHDSAYDPGSPMSERVQVQHRAQESSLINVFLVPAAAPDTDAIPVLARIDAESDTNVIDYEMAKVVCGYLIKEGQGVRVCWRRTEHDQDGNNTTQIQCVVGRTEEVNIVFARDFGRLKARSEPPSDRRFSASERAEFDKIRAKHAALLVNAIAEEELLRNKRRPPEDDDEDGQRLAQRLRRGPG